MNLGPVWVRVAPAPCLRVGVGLKSKGFGLSGLCSQRHLQNQEERSGPARADGVQTGGCAREEAAGTHLLGHLSRVGL